MPDEAGWQGLLDDAVRVLRASAAAKTPGGVGVDTDLARQEFISGGQQVSLQEYVGVRMQLPGCYENSLQTYNVHATMQQQ
jgi:hypothetical protein